MTFRNNSFILTNQRAFSKEFSPLRRYLTDIILFYNLFRSSQDEAKRKATSLESRKKLNVVPPQNIPSNSSFKINLTSLSSIESPINLSKRNLTEPHFQEPPPKYENHQEFFSQDLLDLINKRIWSYLEEVKTFRDKAISISKLDFAYPFKIEKEFKKLSTAKISLDEHTQQIVSIFSL